jgi:hypothetical protein
VKTIIVKLNDQTLLDGPTLIRTLIPGVVGVEPLFPGDKEFVTLLSVTLSDDVSVSNAIAALENDPNFQYAHIPQPRHVK